MNGKWKMVEIENSKKKLPFSVLIKTSHWKTFDSFDCKIKREANIDNVFVVFEIPFASKPSGKCDWFKSTANANIRLQF